MTKTKHMARCEATGIQRAPRIEVERCPHGVKTYAPCVECRPPSDPEVRRAAIEQAKRQIRESLPITEGAEQ